MLYLVLMHFIVDLAQKRLRGKTFYYNCCILSSIFHLFEKFVNEGFSDCHFLRSVVWPDDEEIKRV